MRLPKVAYLRIVSRSNKKKLGKRAPHNGAFASSTNPRLLSHLQLPAAHASKSNPATSTSTSTATKSSYRSQRTMNEQPGDRNGDNRTPDNGNGNASAANLLPQLGLPPRPAPPQQAVGFGYVTNNGPSENRGDEAQVRQHGQPTPVGVFNNNPLSNAPGGMPALPSRFPPPPSFGHAGFHPGGRPPTNCFTVYNFFNGPPPPPPFFTGAFPHQPPHPPMPSAVPFAVTSDAAQSPGPVPGPSGVPQHPRRLNNNMPQPQGISPNSGPSNEGGAVLRPKSKHKQPKIYLPAPLPTLQYLRQASFQAVVVHPPSRKLVVLDLNGTLLFRPNAHNNPRRMVARPFLEEFLEYLFDNFAVMIWSSARPANVAVLVETGLGEYRHRLVATWARDTLGLEARHYNANVQCYKNLQLVWDSGEVQSHMFGNGRFDQRNTILIDDSALKAAAQPHNLLEIPEFKGNDDETNGAAMKNVLMEVAGYLEVLKMQEDVSRFIHKDPFRANGDWQVKWEDLGVGLHHEH